MTLSQKSIHFAKKILKHNPLLNKHQHNHLEKQHTHQNCNHSTNQPIKPYLHVHDHRKQRQIYQKSTPQKLQCMRSFKDEGNEHFKLKRYLQASHYYNKVIIFADYTFPELQKQQKQMDELVQQANCNLGITLVKLGQDKKAIDNFRQSINGLSKKIIIKSYYWLIKCYIKGGEFLKAKQNIDKLNKVEQDTIKQVKELQQQLRKGEQNYNKRSKTVYGQMFGKQATNIK